MYNISKQKIDWILQAKELTIIVKDMMWVKRSNIGMPPPSTPPNMTEMSGIPPKLSILEGPWEFKINL